MPAPANARHNQRAQGRPQGQRVPHEPKPPAYYGGRGPVNLEHARLETNDEYESLRRKQQQTTSNTKPNQPPVAFDQVQLVIEETLREAQEQDAQNQGQTAGVRKNSFELTNQGLDEEDEETRRLCGDALLDQFKLIEKFLVFWLPEMAKKPSPTAGLNQADSE